MHRLAYLFLTLSIAAAVGMLLCLFLALFGDLLSGSIGARSWSKLALPFGMASLFAFGVGAALAREASVRAEFDRAVRLLRRDLDQSLSHAPSPAKAVSAVRPAIDRFLRAAESLGHLAPRAWVNLADLVIYDEDDPERAYGRLTALRNQLPRPAQAPQPRA